MDENLPPHLIIEEGPEKGRELVIPAKGARAGRAEENGITIADPAMSRFQCRLYFREGFLHVMDLGSTNETLVNDRPVSDTILRFGDELLIGDSRLRVVNDGLHDSRRNRESVPPPPPAEPDAPEPEPAPILFHPAGEDSAPETPRPGPEAPPTSDEVDLGLGRRDVDLDEEQDDGKRSLLTLLLVTLVTMLVVFGAGGVLLLRQDPPTSGAPAPAARDDRIHIVYEKVVSGEGNIFRYAISLSPDGALAAEVHDLRQQRNIVRGETVDPDRLRQFRTRLAADKDLFLSLRNEYRGLPVGTHESFRLTMAFGREAKTVEVANQLEPDAFRQIRERIEAFANNELGLINIDIPPEELRARADESWQNAQNLYNQRDVKNENLWRAAQKLTDVIFLLETIEPKPDYYEQAVTLRQQWRRQLIEKVKDLDFEAVRAYNMGNLTEARRLYQRILVTLPDKSSSFYKRAYNTLVQIEQESKE